MADLWVLSELDRGQSSRAIQRRETGRLSEPLWTLGKRFGLVFGAQALPTEAAQTGFEPHTPTIAPVVPTNALPALWRCPGNEGVVGGFFTLDARPERTLT